MTDHPHPAAPPGRATLRVGAAAGALLAVALLGACATHPAGGRGPSAPIPDEDVSLGERAFPDARQAAGGDWVADPALSAYVAEVGHKVAAASDQPDLPWDFVIIDNAVPDAWSLPGGKVAVHRGLLAALSSEAELAAVLAHQVAHAAADRGARRIERDLWLTLGTDGVPAATGAGRHDMVVGGARLGSVLARRGRSPEAEAAADRKAMTALAGAGYDPAAAVALQERYVALAEKGATQWRAGLFDNHPPSRERLDADRTFLATLPAGGTVGKEPYAARVARLLALAPAYERMEAGERALAEGDGDGAVAAAGEAIERAPDVARFHLLRGRALLARGDAPAAVAALDEAVRRDSGYFLPWLIRGVARRQAGDDAGARDDLEHSLGLLPTDTAHLNLGEMDLKAGAVDAGKRHLREVENAGGPAAARAGETLARLEILDVPGRYVAVGVGLTPDGYVFFTVENRSPLAVRDVRVAVRLTDPATGAERRAEFTFDGPFAPEARERRDTHFGPFGPEVTRTLRTDVTAARLAE